jgi:hypothetical protein
MSVPPAHKRDFEARPTVQEEPAAVSCKHICRRCEGGVASNVKVMEKERVGEDSIPDLVFFHLKSLDAVGHRYGVYSGEIYNYMFFADYMIKKVITWLDKNVGKDNYTVAFFGDHGGNNVNTSGRWIVNEDIKESLEGQFGASILTQQGGDQFWLNPEVLQTSGASVEEVARWMESNMSWIVKTYTRSEVEASSQCQ